MRALHCVTSQIFKALFSTQLIPIDWLPYLSTHWCTWHPWWSHLTRMNEFRDSNMNGCIITGSSGAERDGSLGRAEWKHDSIPDLSRHVSSIWQRQPPHQTRPIVIAEERFNPSSLRFSSADDWHPNAALPHLEHSRPIDPFWSELMSIVVVVVVWTENWTPSTCWTSFNGRFQVSESKTGRRWSRINESISLKRRLFGRLNVC